MKKILCFLSIAIAAAAVEAQTNPAPPTVSQREIGLHAGRGYYDGNARQVVYYDHVVITNAQGRLACERLTINLPPEGAVDSHPTNAVAETNLDIIYINNKGETNHLTADKGIYDYKVVNTVTNEIFTFTGHATNTGASYWFTGEPLVWDNIKGRFDFGRNVEIHSQVRATSDKGTNTSPLNFLK